MDTLSGSVSTFKVQPLTPTTNNSDFYHFKKTPYAKVPPPHVSSTSIKTKPTFSHKCSSTFVPLSSSSNTSSPKPSPLFFHQNPSTGYAAAIIHVAQTNNSLHSVQKDITRLLNFLQRVNFQSTMVNPSMVEEHKGQAMMRQVVEQGNFHRYVVALMKMLLKKNKMGILEEVLEEFERIYDELCGTQVVLVSSTKKMREDEVFGIAKKVQQLSGAVRIKENQRLRSTTKPSS
ncbi:putative ATPase, OSCP/delta subunit, F1F0 ATP synthase OSCP/delta subunit domain-containing protein [Lupinus albus]|uniref:Putative ATPase, OSCP/delta subunit, F1F0 ATP synthase OSCP/delta subunit domain-containing protein n=1 Tax=Lupinus albus TaxID=3870 RepID=A0A6A4P5P6_LUPAL|nr:putative ATPase, OSCP/delta subunit, F1F0 ATP synthase OSCP/delta subunit domain-containing protein [Lupinus albus]